MYTFRRHFWVDIPVGTTVVCSLNFNIIVDDKLDEVRLNSVPLGMNTGLGAACNQNSWTTGGILFSGDNYIDVDVLNYDFSSNGTTPSPMILDMEGWISCSTPVLVNNNYYIPNTLASGFGINCVPDNIYDLTPKFTVQCIPAPGTVATVTITNYDASQSYTTSSGGSPVGLTTSTFPGSLGKTYTVTTIANGCSFIGTVTITNNVPICTLTTAIPCIANSPFGLSVVNCSGTNGVIPYTFQYTSTGTQNVPSYFNAHAVGTYTVHITDAVGCTNTSTTNIGNLFSVNAICTNGPPCDYSASSIYNFNAVTNPIPSNLVGNLHYSWNGATPTLVSTHNNTGANAYSVTVTDDYGCSADASYSIFHTPVVVVSSNNAPCQPTFSYTSTIPAVSQYWDDPINGVSWLSHTFTPGLSIPPPNTTYTVTATDANGCTGSSTVHYIQDPFCCNTQVYSIPTNKKFSSNGPYNNGTSTNILNAFYGSPAFWPAGNVISTTYFILLDGNIIIDVPITFSNCPYIGLTGGTELILNPNTTLKVENSNMRSLCTYMWKGMYASSSSEKIHIVNSSLRDMSEGVVVENGAKIESTFGTYTDNFIGIQIRNAPIGYYKINLNCIITDNTFTSTNYFLLPPHNNQQKCETGILISRCKEFQIGYLSGGTSKNTFDNLYNGVRIKGSGMGSIENYYFYDNYFNNIKSDFGTISNEASKLATWASAGHRGAGIYSRPVGVPFPIPNHTLYLINDYDNLTFYDCDKATVLLTTSAVMSLNIVKKCLMGFMNSAANNQKYTIHDNNISEGIIGMRFVGNVGTSVVNNNWLIMRDTWSGGGLVFPIGIDVQALGGGNLTLGNNDVKLTCVAGSGITLRSTGPNVIAFQNDIHINDIIGFPTTYPVVASGIFVEKANGSILQGNKLIGNTTLLTSPNSWDGARLSSSINCKLDCNHFTKSKTGLSIVSNCVTSSTSVKGNTFNMHGIGLVFQNLGTPSLLGNIGDAGNDNNNIFINSALSSSPPSVVGKSIFRWVPPLPLPTIPFGGKIFTNPSNTYSISPTYSGSNVMPPFVMTPFPLNYNIGAFSTASINPSCPPWSFMTMLAPTGQDPIDEEMAEDIAADNISYPEFEEGSRWIDRDMLYRALWGDSTIWLSNTDLVSFMNQQSLTYTDELFNIDRMLNSLDSSLASDSIAFMNKISLIQNENNSIISIVNFEINEKLMNTYILKSMTEGIESLTESEREIIDSLAFSCPFLNGAGVYKARVLQATYAGSINYDDGAICHNSGVYKNGSTHPFDIGIDPALLEASGLEGIKLYPNPASTSITIEYGLKENETARLFIYDMLGRCIKTIEFPPQ